MLHGVWKMQPIHSGLFEGEDRVPLREGWKLERQISDRLWLFYQIREGTLHRRPVCHADFRFRQM